jgi:hypothetical protein
MSFVNEPIASNTEHLIIDVAKHDVALRTCALRNRSGKVPRAGGQIEGLHPWTNCKGLDSNTLPQSVEPCRHQIIHQVIPTGD